MVQLLASSLFFLFVLLNYGEAERHRRQIPLYAIPWPNASVPYLIHPSFTAGEKAGIHQAMDHIASKTCLQFKELEKDLAKFPEFGILFEVSESQCNCESIGREEFPRLQVIRLSRNPTKNCLDTIGHVVHEILHAIGMDHTPSRPDRKKYVHLNLDNVLPQYHGNFEMIPIYNYSQYDYSSNLHYPAYLSWSSSSINPNIPTLIPKDKRYIHALGNRRGGSFLDYHSLNKFYKCYDRCNETDKLRCRNQGVPNPNDCSTCLCPEGYAGKYCESKPNDCGWPLYAKNTWDTVILNIGHPNNPRKFTYETCVTWIKAEKGHNVEIEILSVKAEVASEITAQEKACCRLYGIEVKIKGNARLGGPVYCMPEDIQQRFISRAPMAPIILYNKAGYQEYRIRYRATKRGRPRKTRGRIISHPFI